MGFEDFYNVNILKKQKGIEVTLQYLLTEDDHILILSLRNSCDNNERIFGKRRSDGKIERSINILMLIIMNMKVGKLPPHNSTSAWGMKLWKYLNGDYVMYYQLIILFRGC